MWLEVQLPVAKRSSAPLAMQKYLFGVLNLSFWNRTKDHPYHKDSLFNLYIFRQEVCKNQPLEPLQMYDAFPVSFMKDCGKATPYTPPPWQNQRETQITGASSSEFFFQGIPESRGKATDLHLPTNTRQAGLPVHVVWDIHCPYWKLNAVLASAYALGSAGGLSMVLPN